MLDVLFVCTGNICRSPLAEALLRDRSGRLLDGAVRVRSAGTWARSGHPAMPETISAAARLGLDIEEHAASPLTAASIERADLILGLTAEHRDEAARIVPEARARAFTLKELVALLKGVEPARGRSREAVLDRIAQADALRSDLDRGIVADLDVIDPLGLGAEFHLEVAREIEAAVDALVRDLFGASLPAHAGEG